MANFKYQIHSLGQLRIAISQHNAQVRDYNSQVRSQFVYPDYVRACLREVLIQSEVWLKEYCLQYAPDLPEMQQDFYPISEK